MIFTHNAGLTKSGSNSKKVKTELKNVPEMSVFREAIINPEVNIVSTDKLTKLSPSNSDKVIQPLSMRASAENLNTSKTVLKQCFLFL